MRIPLIAGNWKMYKTPGEALDWLGTFLSHLEPDVTDRTDLLLCVPATHIASLAARAKGGPVAIGGQDLSPFDEGAYTGDLSGAMLRDAGANFVIVGHSERRAYHGETDEVVRDKLAAARRHDLIPILCVGEAEAERDAGRAETVVLDQLRTALDGVTLTGATELVVAYEPVWAIGTGRTATAEDAQSMSAAIRAELGRLLPGFEDGIRILYGGSMKPSNAAELLRQPDVDGGLIGSASLKVDDLHAIAEAAR
ncbi:MAG: triose-phosphate isomerase [Trueperaceae bacterium]|nr:triose-phosphate isomerase [Trueperaceae bacterium]